MKVSVKNEYGKLDYVLLAYPQNFEIKEIINKMQRKYKGTIDQELANSQYNHFVNTLIQHDVKVQFLNLVDSPEQVYTRDIGFTIHHVLFKSNMAKKIRQEEPNSLADFVNDEPIYVYEMENNAEGGDVFVHHDKVFIGVSKRTSLEGIEEIKAELKRQQVDVEVIPVHFNPDQLHLDCVFNILDDDTCIITDYIYNPEVITKHFKQVITMEGKDVDYLATNFVHIGNKKILTTNKTMERKLEDLGYRPIYVEYTEFIKSGGSVRCSTLPIKRS